MKHYNMDFVALDFELATGKRDTVCEVGIAIYERGIIKSESWLVKPYCFPLFDSMAQSIHKITADDLEEMPEFYYIWEDLSPYLENKFIVCHNASFDISVLKSTLTRFNIEFPSLKFACTSLLSKKFYPELSSYSLGFLRKKFGLNANPNHRARKDAECTAELFKKILNDNDINSITDFKNQRIRIGELSSKHYKPFSIANPSNNTSSYKAFKLNPSEILTNISADIDSPFYNKSIVLTGFFNEGKKAIAEKLASIGGVIKGNVTKDLDYLICGVQDTKLVGDDGLSGKQELAIKFNSNGCQIKIITEEELLNLLK